MKKLLIASIFLLGACAEMDSVKLPDLSATNPAAPAVKDKTNEYQTPEANKETGEDLELIRDFPSNNLSPRYDCPEIYKSKGYCQ